MTVVYLSIIQPKKRAETKTKYWYCDPSFVVLRRCPGSQDWIYAACVFSGVKRANYCEITMNPLCEYCCIPFSSLASRKDKEEFPFRITTYSSAHVSRTREQISTIHRDAALRIIHQRLLTNETKLLYPVASKSILVCVQGEGCMFFLALNGSDDHFLSVKLSFRLQDGVLLAFGENDWTYDIAPRSQRVIGVLTRSGKMTATTEMSFLYLSGVISVKKDNRPSAKVGAHPEFGCSIGLMGDLMTRCIDETQINERGGDTVETYLWIPQIGSSS